jgi:hypothetical protein
MSEPLDPRLPIDRQAFSGLWVVVLDSISKDNDRFVAEEMVLERREQLHDSNVWYLDSDEFSEFNDGFWVVYTGYWPPDDEADADEHCIYLDSNGIAPGCNLRRPVP